MTASNGLVGETASHGMGHDRGRLDAERERGSPDRHPRVGLDRGDLLDGSTHCGDLPALGDSVTTDHSLRDTVSHTTAILSIGESVPVSDRSKAVVVVGVGARLAETVRLKGTNVSQLERDSGVSRSTLHRVMREDVISPSVAAKVAGALGVSESELLSGSAAPVVQKEEAYRVGILETVAAIRAALDEIQRGALTGTPVSSAELRRAQRRRKKG